MNGVLPIVVPLLWLWLGALGWCITIAAHFTHRYYPALAHTGTAIGLVPAYALIVWVARAQGWVSRTANPWQQLALALTIAAACLSAALALRHVLLGIEQERHDRRIAALSQQGE